MKAKPTEGSRLSVEKCCRALQGTDAERAAAEHLLARRHWIYHAGDFDERTGQMLPVPFGSVCARLGAASDWGAAGWPKDRLYRIVEHALGPLQEILRHLHERLVREHASLPIRAVRELDSASFFALSRRPGRTVREKLADRPYLWAVARRWTLDSSENRLVKAFCVRLAHLLQMRARCLEQPDEPWLGDLLATIESWLQSPAAKDIGRWENLPPNNLLLQHRDYRRVWDAWRWTQYLDDDMQQDHDHRLGQWTTIAFWSIVSRLATSPGVRLLAQPCYFDYEKFTIVPGRAGKAVQASVEGLMASSLDGRSCGVVSRLGVDKNGEAFGFATLPARGKVFFHSRMFPERSDFERIREGTALAFELVEEAEGKLKTANPVVLETPGEFRIEMDRGSQIVILPPVGDQVEMECEADGQHVQVHIGSETVTAEMSPQGAAKIAHRALSAAFGLSRRTSAHTSSAEAPAKSDPGSLRVVDLCTLRPRFAESDRHGVLPFRLFWQKWHPEGRDPVEIDLGSAQAIALGTDVTTVSILDLLDTDPAHPSAILSQAAQSFANKLQGTLRGDSLTYIVPDATDEFALATLRRCVNAVFRIAEPLPRSIAAVFSWQSSAVFATSGITEGDCVLALDTVGERLSATPLLARKSKNLAARLPESAGIYWERCPCVQSGPRTTSVETAVSLLKKLGCPFPEDVARLCGFQGLIDEGCDVSWQNETGLWYTAPHDSEQAIKSTIRGLEDPWAELGHGLEQELGRLGKGARVFTLLAGDIFNGAGSRLFASEVLRSHEVVDLGHEHEPHRGGMVLHRWQERAGDIPLWRDHLPELSMRIPQDGRYSRFYLVKDITVAPRRGQAVPIAIKNTFELPVNNRSYYRFPLLQGVEGGELRYEAFLRSPAFPLKEALPVALELTYSYGTDTPYDLVFTPLTATPGFPSVRAEWRLREEGTDLPSLFPTLPAPEPWAKFEVYPTKDSRGTTSLLGWLRRDLAWIKTRTAALDDQRHVGVMTSNWKTNSVGKHSVDVDCDAGRVFCHEDDFVDPASLTNVGCGDVLSFDIERRPGQLRGRWIVVGDRLAPEEQGQVLDSKMRQVLQRVRKGLRFPFLTVWSAGHSLSEPDVPADFREVMLGGTETLLALLRQSPSAGWSRVRMELSDEALFLLCCMHRDAPSAVADPLKAVFSNQHALLQNLGRLWRHVALALGDCHLDWQRHLLDGTIALLKKEEPVQVDVCSLCLRILGIALWRCGSLLSQLTQADVLTIGHRATRVLEDHLAILSDNPKAVDSESLKDHLELVLGLLRTRGSADEGMRELMTPDKPIAKTLARHVEQVIDLVSAHEIPIRSRLTLNVEKPPELHKTPDLLYALKLYLTGDAGAQAIRVMAVSDDDD